MNNIQEQFNIFKNSDHSLTYISSESGRSVNMFKGIKGDIELSNSLGVIFVSSLNNEDLLSIVQYMTNAEEFQVYEKQEKENRIRSATQRINSESNPEE